jgi:hypothetical protein
LGPFGLETRQLALGDGAGVGAAVGVGHGATVAPLPVRHDGDGLGAAIEAPLTPLCAPVGRAELLPPPPPQAAVSIRIPRMIPSRRMPWTPIACEFGKPQSRRQRTR